MLYQAQYRFEQQNADFALALNGDETAPGFAEVADEYANTPAGNLANLYAAACNLRLGDFDAAQKYIDKYSAVDGIPGDVVNAMAAGIKAEIAVEKKDYAKAATLFEQAAKLSENDFTTPMYLRKAALVYKQLGQEEKAKEIYKTIKESYSSSYDAREAEKNL
jgi:TolA-binding protein